MHHCVFLVLSKNGDGMSVAHAVIDDGFFCCTMTSLASVYFILAFLTD